MTGVRQCWGTTCLGICVLALCACAACGAEVLLAWDAPTVNTDGTPLTDLAGYRVYCGPEEEGFDLVMDVGNATHARIEGLDDHTVYVICARAYTQTGMESAFSDELTWAYDFDADEMPDDWEVLHFGGTSAGGGGAWEDYDGDAVPNLHEFIAGTDPADATSYATVHVRRQAQRMEVSFFAHAALGPGCLGRSRLYTLEACGHLAAPDWRPVSGFESVVASNRVVTYAADVPPDARFYRTRIRLE